MKMFTIGPVEMYPETLKMGSLQLPYFRTSEFSEIMLENAEMFRESICAQKGAEIIFLTASGTAAMEAAVINCFTAEDKLLVINGGSFGQRFVEICKMHHIPCEELKLSFGTILTEELLEPYAKTQYTALLVNLHETSTGQLYSIEILSRFCRQNGLYLIVDGIGAYLADKIAFADQGIDALIVSSQKALALPPGLSLVAVSERLYRERVSKIPSSSFYLDFKQHIQNQQRGQTPFTPAVGILLQLHERLKEILKEGTEQIIQNTAEMAAFFRKGAKALDYQIPEYPLSNALTPLIFTRDAKTFYHRLKNEYEMVVTPSGGELESVLIRVGHLGNLRKKDYEELLQAMKQMGAMP